MKVLILNVLITSIPLGAGLASLSLAFTMSINTGALMAYPAPPFSLLNAKHKAAQQGAILNHISAKSILQGMNVQKKR
ncbi:hypothetical protein [Alteromonas gilva]|uniref:Uncharacterized protein n=1 Tax=Alteromonas gilva TaxID=2987522 RepID=A0ABT5KZK1_9ALTE|nr:hypothetical protein [Alteromonas gilva]MDC8830191.1 hypothetical protein [Alteromonas gilva]